MSDERIGQLLESWRQTEPVISAVMESTGMTRMEVMVYWLIVMVGQQQEAGKKLVQKITDDLRDEWRDG